MFGRIAFFLLLTLGIGATSVAQAYTFDFSYSGNGVSAMGTLTATTQSPGHFLVTGINGERNGFPITGLVAPGNQMNYFTTTPSNDNILVFPANPAYVDSQGIAYTSNNLNYDLFSFGNSSVFEQQTIPSGGYRAVNVALNVARAPAGAPAPVPGGGLLSFLALGLAVVWRGQAVMARRRGDLAHADQTAAG